MNNQSIKTCIVMIAHLNVHDNLFEKALVISTDKYYENVGINYTNTRLESLNDEYI